MAPSRVRRTPQESRRLILDAAEQLLIQGGPATVQVRSVPERVGMTDAGVAHHFGSRQDLLSALLRHGGGRLRDAVGQAIDRWSSDADIVSLIETIASVYGQGYAALAVSLHAAGWRDPGAGILEPVVRSLHAARKRAGQDAPITDTRLAVAALHQALALDPVYGAEFRRSAGIGASAADRPGPQVTWWAAVLSLALGLTDGQAVRPTARSSGGRA